MPAWQAVATTGIAAAVAPLPDVDQRHAWGAVDDVLPDELLGHGGPMRHRGITHWWGVALAAAAAVWVLWPQWWAWAAVAGWWSHLAGDLLVGAESRCRGAGIPMMPWWRHRGLGARNGGWVDRACTLAAHMAVGLAASNFVP
jgi:membrane-bound metal-dependent hydrolase YbcI (DUF457 family)